MLPVRRSFQNGLLSLGTNVSLSLLKDAPPETAAEHMSPNRLRQVADKIHARSGVILEGDAEAESDVRAEMRFLDQSAKEAGGSHKQPCIWQ